MWNIATDVLVKRVRIIYIGDYTLISLFVNGFVIMRFFFWSSRSCIKACPGVLKVLQNASKQERVVNGVHKCADILEK